MNIHFFPHSTRHTGSSRIRVYNLAKKLEEQGHKITITENKAYPYEIIVVQKAILPTDFLIDCKKAGIVTIFDIDDYIPALNEQVQHYTAVCVSTNYLKEKLEKYNPNTFVVENSLDIDDYSIPLKQKSSNKKLVWYGNSSNAGILNKLKLENVTRIMDNGDIEYSIETIDHDLQLFDLVLIPQARNISTLSKTHCRMLKALYLGLPCMISPLPEYLKLADLVDFPKEFIVEDLKGWQAKIEDYQHNRITFNFDFQKAREIILHHYSVDAITESFIKEVQKVSLPRS